MRRTVRESRRRLLNRVQSQAANCLVPAFSFRAGASSMLLWSSPLHAGRACADDGNEYYIDPKTKERTAQRPEAEAWISVYEDDRERSYYFNEVSNVRVLMLSRMPCHAMEHLSKRVPHDNVLCCQCGLSQADSCCSAAGCSIPHGTIYLYKRDRQLRPAGDDVGGAVPVRVEEGVCRRQQHGRGVSRRRRVGRSALDR